MKISSYSSIFKRLSPPIMYGTGKIMSSNTRSTRRIFRLTMLGISMAVKALQLANALAISSCIKEVEVSLLDKTSYRKN